MPDQPGIPEAGKLYYIPLSSGNVGVGGIELEVSPAVENLFRVNKCKLNFATGAVFRDTGEPVTQLARGRTMFRWAKSCKVRGDAPPWVYALYPNTPVFPQGRLTISMSPADGDLITISSGHTPVPIFEAVEPKPHRKLWLGNSPPRWVREYRASAELVEDTVRRQLPMVDVHFTNVDPLQNPKGRIPSVAKLAAVCSRLAARQDIPHAYITEGCEERAHAAAQELRRGRYNVEKLFVSGDLEASNAEMGTVRWRYHVAPLVFARAEDGRVEPYVIDISFSPDKPLRPGEWIQRFNKGESIDVDVTHSRQWEPTRITGRTTKRFAAYDKECASKMSERAGLLREVTAFKRPIASGTDDIVAVKSDRVYLVERLRLRLERLRLRGG